MQFALYGSALNLDVQSEGKRGEQSMSPECGLDPSLGSRGRAVFSVLQAVCDVAENVELRRNKETGLEAAVTTYSTPAQENTPELGMAKVSCGKQKAVIWCIT